MQATWLSPVWLGDKERMLIPETFLWLLHSITRFSKKWLRFIEQNAIKSHACFHHLLWSGRPLMLEQLTTTLWPPRIYLFLYLFLECFPLSLFLSWMTRSLLKWIFFIAMTRHSYFTAIPFCKHVIYCFSTVHKSAKECILIH